MRIVCRQTILMKYHTLFLKIYERCRKNLSSAAVVMGSLRVNHCSDNASRPYWEILHDFRLSGDF